MVVELLTQASQTSTSDRPSTQQFAGIGTDFALPNTPWSGEARPTQVIDRFVSEAMRCAVVSFLDVESVFFAEIPGFRGPWAEGATEDAAYSDLESALRAWLDLKLTHQDRDIPEVGEINLNVL